MKDIALVHWSEEAFNGNYKNMPIIKTPEENRTQHVKKLIKNGSSNLSETENSI